MNDDLTAAIVDVDGRQATFRVILVQLYHRNNSTVIPRDDDDNDNCGDADDDEFILETEVLPPRKRGRPKGSKNKPKLAPIETNDVNLTQREEDNLVLSRKLRATSKITTLGELFELSTKAEIYALITRGRTIIADLPTQLRDAYPKGTIIVVVKPLYGIAEAGAY
ncbi:conserved hypothetical protein [Pyrenophora tritici-repentis Pt-1C-BFP]|uniref:Uncharacterized protein n=1 Tax=Pyrenophora tritici-repentis (strain Pt-1C-BFP) TaxID=426418 RepID=B2WI51_PYRTR|nr:uncharacterized protein PTRG_09660 [Pyrenophora tritici-repentis Pt-1C-BFP]EDU42711.1 conserved hypothetical protein [Pyrenophora tritici-repentis Pt-1C-BFP]